MRRGYFTFIRNTNVKSDFFDVRALHCRLGNERTADVSSSLGPSIRTGYLDDDDDEAPRARDYVFLGLQQCVRLVAPVLPFNSVRISKLKT